MIPPASLQGVELAQETNIDLVVADIAATAGQLRARPDVAGKVAAIGYCLGGRLADMAAATGNIDAAVDKVKATFGSRHNATFHLYPGAGHGFNCTNPASYNQRAAALARGSTLTFLAERLQFASTNSSAGPTVADFGITECGVRDRSNATRQRSGWFGVTGHMGVGPWC